MVLGLGEMRLAPRDFWALSLCEWRALTVARFGAAVPALTRAGLHALMRNHPDDR